MKARGGRNEIRGSSDRGLTIPLEDANNLLRSGVHFIHRELCVLPVTDYAALTELSCIRIGVRSSGLVVVTALARRRKGWGGRREASRTCHHRDRADVVGLVRVVHMASGADAQITRESDLLIIGLPQHIRIREVLAAMDTVDLPSHVDTLLRSAVDQRRVVAERAFLSSGAATAVNEREVLMASGTVFRGYHNPPRGDRALVHGEGVLYRDS